MVFRDEKGRDSLESHRQMKQYWTRAEALLLATW